MAVASPLATASPITALRRTSSTTERPRTSPGTATAKRGPLKTSLVRALRREGDRVAISQATALSGTGRARGNLGSP